ncbi:MAG: hypothetical protein A3A80_02480 [Candidatus Terrybacteria bacterium RIFCSPLOWO2_01_FULL_44_24]|uniref:Multidrug ABC transporter substrate-binding protein n=1 Tax=Candidatus Terrybacteria bacterium RIFCSPHIGHO2_01_FULL_43_35 TaxID=1802361 RepID=A0A1G2PEJ1_9BACT|nr:MAG: hypothetical protein A2828_02275 [Candidatus Terrybacteria bacterium RIFCSPHIGHO2_01_FULL_43_35]OHA50306.1 MAG: hypothetical protein A3B75_00720 [Candidatus Terrybacteria bacterium RIFCSPHIGHO2_02_FULL_43_14]OHA50940.1 MAG: hypothetical protein A3A80_02480 [Candidatus Terrybacteria bacterium RIFCSPLOWO2_01_FULL_44_24]
MLIRDLARIAMGGLTVNIGRSMLTILGIVIGVASIILIVSVGNGAQRLILSQFEGIGSRVLVIQPGRQPQGPSDFFEFFTDSLKERDVKALTVRGSVPGIVDVAPVVAGNFSVVWRDESKRATTFGATDIFADILDVSTASGEFFTNEDVRQRTSVVVLGYKLNQDIFGDSDAIGQVVKIKNVNFRVGGVLPKKGNVGLLNVDDVAILPYTAAQEYLTGTDYFQEILIRVENEDVMPRVEEDVKNLLRMNHNITDPAKDDFHVMTPADVASRVSTVTGILTAFLTAVAAISLIVGGIGIMNIMLVSVSERTGEIGLRKAIGATNNDILKQFLLEAVILTASGGVIGMILGNTFSYVLSLALSYFLDVSWKFVLPLQAMAVGIFVSTIVGVVFGIYPARRASRLDPVEALRYE